MIKTRMERGIEENLDWGLKNVAYLQPGTLLFRTESDKYNVKPHKYFSYLSPDFIAGYREHKKTWISRCKNENSQIEFYVVRDEIPLIRLPVNNYTYDDPDDDDIEYFNKIKKYLPNKGLTQEEHDCFMHALEESFNMPDKEYRDKECSTIDGKQVIGLNPDYMLDKVFDKLRFNGWIRLTDEMKSVEEVLLTQTGLDKNNLKLLKVLNCQFLTQDLPNIPILKDEDDHFLTTYKQPDIIYKMKRQFSSPRRERKDISKLMLRNIGTNYHKCSNRYFNIETGSYFCENCDK